MKTQSNKERKCIRDGKGEERESKTQASQVIDR